MAHLASIRDIGEEREPIPATVCSPGCHLVKDAEVSVATPPDYRAASPLRLRDSTLHQYFYDLCCKVTINFLLNLDQVMVVRHSLMMPCCTIKVSQRTVVIVFYSPSVPLTINHSRWGGVSRSVTPSTRFPTFPGPSLDLQGSFISYSPEDLALGSVNLIYCLIKRGPVRF